MSGMICVVDDMVRAHQKDVIFPGRGIELTEVMDHIVTTSEWKSEMDKAVEVYATAQQNKGWSTFVLDKIFLPLWGVLIIFMTWVTLPGWLKWFFLFLILLGVGGQCYVLRTKSKSAR
jgi:hypothetical protein